MTTTTPIPTAAAAAAPATPSSAGAAAAGHAVGAGDPFTSLLAAALGDGVPSAVAEVLGDLAEQADPAAAAGEELSQDALAEAVAAVAGAVPALRAPLTEWVVRTAAGDGSQDGDVGGSSDDAEVAPPGEGIVAAAEVSSEGIVAPGEVSSEGIVEAGELPSQDGAPTAPAATPATPATPASTVAPATPAVPSAPAAAGTPADAAAVAAATTPPVPAAVATTPDADANATTEVPPAPATPSASATSATAANAASSGTAATEDTGLHARIVARVVQAVEALENAPPPRRMTVEVPDSDGLRLQVAMRGGEVHVSVQAGTGQPDLGAWGRELASTLAARGMTLGGFQTGTDDHPGRQPDQPDQPDPDQPSPQGGRPRAPRTNDRPARDGDLRL